MERRRIKNNRRVLGWVGSPTCTLPPSRTAAETPRLRLLLRLFPAHIRVRIIAIITSSSSSTITMKEAIEMFRQCLSPHGTPSRTSPTLNKGTIIIILALLRPPLRIQCLHTPRAHPPPLPTRPSSTTSTTNRITGITTRMLTTSSNRWALRRMGMRGLTAPRPRWLPFRMRG